MKKFFITFFILLAFGGTAFFFGWANFAVPPGQYGVITSKTHGIDPKVVKGGEFRWVWYKLIPTNVKISAFRLDQKVFPVEYKSSLPSGNTYAQFIGQENINFAWELNGNITFTINPDMLVNITVKNNLTDQESLDNYLADISNNIKMVFLNHISSGELETERLENLLSGRSDKEIETEVRSRYPEILDFSFVINKAELPNFILYREIRQIYEDFLYEQRQYITSSFGRRAESHIESQLHFSELERYGDLLTKYPILLDFMKLREGIEE